MSSSASASLGFPNLSEASTAKPKVTGERECGTLRIAGRDYKIMVSGTAVTDQNISVVQKLRIQELVGTILKTYIIQATDISEAFNPTKFSLSQGKDFYVVSYDNAHRHIYHQNDSECLQRLTNPAVPKVHDQLFSQNTKIVNIFNAAEAIFEQIRNDKHRSRACEATMTLSTQELTEDDIPCTGKGKGKEAAPADQAGTVQRKRRANPDGEDADDDPPAPHGIKRSAAAASVRGFGQSADQETTGEEPGGAGAATVRIPTNIDAESQTLTE